MLPFYPIETRPLYKAESDQRVGTIRLWVEIFNIQDAEKSAMEYSRNYLNDYEKLKKTTMKNSHLSSLRQEMSKVLLHSLGISRYKWDISLLPPEKLELRVVVWEVNDCPIDDPEGMTDIYVRCSLPSYKNGNLSKKTDTHIRSEGFGSFNWRMVFPLELDSYTEPGNYQLSFHLYDKDLLTSDDYIASVDINVWKAVRGCVIDGRIYELKDESIRNPKIVLKCTPRRADQGKEPTLTISVACVTARESQQVPVGEGQDDPNQNPFLPPPTGRFQVSMNPFTLLTSLVGRDQRQKACCCCISCCICLLILIFVPLTLSNLLMRVLNAPLAALI